MRYLRLYIIFACALIFYSGGFYDVYGAEIRLDVNRSSIRTNEQFIVEVVLNNFEMLNAVSGTIKFSEGFVVPIDVRTGNSVINFWLEEPHINSNTITFSGITPGGFSGTQNHLFSVVFEAVSEGVAPLDLIDVLGLLNDGNGTEVAIDIYDSVVVIKPGDSTYLKEVYTDEDPPEPFSPEIVFDSPIFGGDPMLVFATQDKGSGIDHYEVRKGIFSLYIEADNPLRLSSFSVQRKIFVKAVDKYGNEQVVVVVPTSYLWWWELLPLFVILCSVIFVGTCCSIIWKKYIK
jgi:hypothetical protein